MPYKRTPKVAGETYFAGMDCTCMAYNESECCCDVDWTDEKVYVLRERIGKLETALKEIIQISDYTNAGDNCKLLAIEALENET